MKGAVTLYVLLLAMLVIASLILYGCSIADSPSGMPRSFQERSSAVTSATAL